MPTLCVAYIDAAGRSSKLRLQATPSATPSALAANAAAAANLPTDGAVLLHAGRPLEPETPLRLLNLPTGAILNLRVASREAASPSSSSPPPMSAAGGPRAFEDALAALAAERDALATASASLEPLTKALQLVLKIVGNVLTHPGEARYRELPLTSKAYSLKIAPVTGAVLALHAAGFVRNDDAGCLQLPATASDAPLRTARALLTSFLRGLASPPADAPATGALPAPPVHTRDKGKDEAGESGAAAESTRSGVAPMEVAGEDGSGPQIVRMAANAAAAAAAEEDLAAVRSMSSEDEAAWQAKVARASAPVARALGVWDPANGAPPAPPPADAALLADESALFAAAARDLRDKAQALVNAPLKTRALRAREEEAKAMRFERCTIRVRLPDGWIVQACFAPLERVQALYDAITALLQPESPAAQQLVLYITPPRTVLDPATTFYAAGLVPGARVFAASGTLTPTAKALSPPPSIYPSASPVAASSSSTASTARAAPKPKPKASGKKKKPSWLKL
ncbi:uncharacterized protein AMSG_00201 [Thecamonas trahens ATCC 50062]|uniref:UBX domain-containing protein n=1 Tax=Thecamonas trahens ATCC 50062 TaxID=461836 RepID=A0A0L0D468_THETB|nr:hypothetical protein AMSG_00201 [Thecamonas trahens ATCC 50062]KNC46083.1 hypothetical protein AMSG_00201 [Thecamonas trahens ATCC 50062]|eukprot:XP_013763063.1 hypothetical protein AMSG_00201 [Thecamonas trahens ATCC 50062]